VRRSPELGQDTEVVTGPDAVDGLVESQPAIGDIE
jgi:hypothetical protein